MVNFTYDVSRYKAFDPDRGLPLEQIAEGLGWDRNTTYIFKFFISQLTPDELQVLDQVQTTIDLEIIKAMSLVQPECRKYVFDNISQIIEAPSPFLAIETFVEESRGADPLEEVRPKYWICIAAYMQERNIDQWPFNKKAVNFIFSIGYNGYAGLSPRQKAWLKDLIVKDRERPENDRFFINEHAHNEGFAPECAIIQKC